MDVLSTFDLTTNFWTMHPQLKVGFRELYEADESEEKQESSKLMWAIALLVHTDSKYYSASMTKRKELVEEAWLGVQNFDWGEYENEIRLFKELCLSRAQRTLVIWRDKMEEIAKFIDLTPYNFDNRKDIEDALKSLDTLWKRYNTCEEEVLKEKATGVAAGGAMESLSDLNELFTSG